MKISSKTWQNYIRKLARINVRAAGDIVTYVFNHDISTYEGTKELIDYAYAVSTKYGEAAAELSCQMYDAIATVSKASVPAAEPAATVTYGEIAKTIYGTLASTKNPDAVGAAVGRSVKLASVDTLQKNALRDGAEWAWIPAGDTCPYCLMLASNGWRKASKKALKNGHADHIHNNCDCTYCVRFDRETTVEGYDPEKLHGQYINAGNTSRERLNALRRQHYAANREYINTQKRAAYAKRTKWTEDSDDGIIPIQGMLLEALTVEDFCNILQEHPEELGNYNPVTFKRELEARGADVRPLGRGRHKGQLFEEGGGYIINYGGNGAIEYHPAKNSRHGGRYYRLSDSRYGRRWFDTKGNEFDPKAR